MERPVIAPVIKSSTIARVIVVVVLTLALFAVLWQLRGPIIWVLIAALIATALSRPIDRLAKRLPRAIAITVVYLGLVLIPVGLLLLAVPPLVGEAQKLIESLPGLIQDLQDAMQKNAQLAKILDDFDPLDALKQQASSIPSRITDVAGIIGSIGLGALNSIVAAITILILSVFFASSGGKSIRRGIDLYGGDRAPLFHQVAERTSKAIAAYFAGTLLIAVVAGIASYTVMSILGIPYAVALAVLCGTASLIPMFGATIAAVFVGIIAALTTSLSVVLAWVVWQVIYQQVENNLVQPQIQKRTVKVPPVATVVGVLFGSSLLGVLGAIVAIPAIAAAIAVGEEWSAWKRGAAAVEGGHDYEQATKARAALKAIDEA
ncbi:MAG: AI-2E family transporter [Solirubrobacteraceae bacterium]|nr:AI-2E family transporter [Solirubrobacteraceae bacterium]